MIVPRASHDRSCARFASAAGSGSDVAQFYRRAAARAVLRDRQIRLRGGILISMPPSTTSICPHRAGRPHDQIEHPLREALRMMKIEPGIEVVSIADIPSGTGPGSSSSFSVALNALYAHQRIFAPRSSSRGLHAEIELAEPIGKQDQWSRVRAAWRRDSTAARAADRPGGRARANPCCSSPQPARGEERFAHQNKAWKRRQTFGRPSAWSSSPMRCATC